MHIERTANSVFQNLSTMSSTRIFKTMYHLSHLNVINTLTQIISP